MADDLPACPGAYALYFVLDRPLALSISQLDNPVLPAGIFVYAGSARGPGGIRARVARHLRRDKSRHWHIDHLSAAVPCTEVQAFPDGRECDLVAALIADGARAPVPGFGSSDCRVCAAHLLRLAGPGQNRDIARR